MTIGRVSTFVPFDLPATEGEVYTTQPGDTWDLVAAMLGRTKNALCQANPHLDPSALSVGVLLQVPPFVDATPTAELPRVTSDPAGRPAASLDTVSGARRMAAASESMARLRLDPAFVQDPTEVFPSLPLTSPAETNEMLARNGFTVDDVRGLLGSLGFPLDPDGTLDGPTTRRSIQAFQEWSGLQATGTLDLDSLIALLEASLARDRMAAPARAAYRPGVGSSSPSGAWRGPVGEVPRPARTAPVDTTNWRAGAGDVTPDQLRKIVPGLSSERAREVAPHLNRAMAEAHIDTPARKAAFIAQLAHESGGFRHMQELASGRAYEGRRDLGNTQPGDGERFKGRGFIQVTGRANYAAASRALGEDFVAHPERASTLENAARIAAWYWNSRGLNEAADRGDFDRITKRINGGFNGKASRDAYFGRALDVLRECHGAPSTGRFVDEAPPVAGQTIPAGQRAAALAQAAQGVASRMGTVGRCAKGVGDSLEAIGVRSRGHAYTHAERLARRPDFREVECDRSDLRSLPAGAVIVWGRSSQKPYGHVTVSLGDGREASDHVQRLITGGSYGTDFGRGPTGKQFRVFLPVG